MRLFDRYILTRIIVGTVFGIFSLSAVLMLGQLFKEIQPLLENQSAPLIQIAKFLWSSVPFMLTFTLPWAFLSAVVLAFGKLSNTNELVGMRMAGWGLPRIGLSVMIFGACLSGLCFWLNGTAAPNAKHDLKNLLIEAVKQDPQSLLSPGMVQKRLGEGSRLYIEDKEGDRLKGFHFYQLEEDAAFPVSYVHAEEVGVDVSEDQSELSLALKEAYIENRKDSSPILIADQAQPWIIEIPNNKRGKKLGAMTNAEIKAEILAIGHEKDEKWHMKRVKERHKRMSMSMACFCLGIIGVPLGMSSRRKEGNSGFIIALVVAGIYFGLLMGLEGVGETLLLRQVMIWLPNALCLLAAFFFYRKASFS